MLHYFKNLWKAIIGRRSIAEDDVDVIADKLAKSLEAAFMNLSASTRDTPQAD